MSAPSIETSSVTLSIDGTGKVGVTATPSPPPCDDLSLALEAISEAAADHVGLSEGKLVKASEASGVADATVLRSEGLKRLIEVTHGQLEFKQEAMSRGALGLLVSVLEHDEQPHIRWGVVKAMRTLCFKNDEAREAIASTPFVRLLAAALEAALNDLEGSLVEEGKRDAAGEERAEAEATTASPPSAAAMETTTTTGAAAGAAGEEGAAAGGAGTAQAGPSRAYTGQQKHAKAADHPNFKHELTMLLDEGLTTAAALCNKHEPTSASMGECRMAALASRAGTLGNKLVCSPVDVSQNRLPGAVISLKAADISKKAMMLGMLLS